MGYRRSQALCEPSDATDDMYRTMSSAVGDFYSGRPKSAPPMRAGGSTEFGHRFAHNGQRKRAFVYGELNAQASDVDEVVFGRDLDSSGGAADVREVGFFRGASGGTSKHLASRRHRVGKTGGVFAKKGFGAAAQQSEIDGVVFNHDIDASSADGIASALSSHPAFVDAIGKPSKTAAEWRAEKEPDLHSVTTASRLPERPPRSNLSSAHVQRLISGGDAHVLWARAGDGSTKLSSAIARGAAFDGAAGRSTEATLGGGTSDLDGSSGTKALVTLPEFDGACGVASRPTDRRHLQRDAWRQMGEVRARHDADADAAAAVVAADAATAAADAAVADAAAADGSVDFLGASAAAPPADDAAAGGGSGGGSGAADDEWLEHPALRASRGDALVRSLNHEQLRSLLATAPSGGDDGWAAPPLGWGDGHATAAAAAEVPPPPLEPLRAAARPAPRAAPLPLAARRASGDASITAAAEVAREVRRASEMSVHGRPSPVVPSLATPPPAAGGDIVQRLVLTPSSHRRLSSPRRTASPPPSHRGSTPRRGGGGGTPRAASPRRSAADDAASRPATKLKPRPPKPAAPAYPVVKA